MELAGLDLELETLPGTVPAVCARISDEQLRAVCATVAQEGGTLLALWGADERDRNGAFLIRAAFMRSSGLLIAELSVSDRACAFPNFAEHFPAASRMQRAIDDMLGLTARNSDSRPWLRHAGWPVQYFPLRRDAGAPEVETQKDERYAFVKVSGDGVHEIAVGPVHAGTIEPGHFRFSVVGEKVLRLEERLGYTHKGIEKRFEALSLMEGQRLAARISGDSTVAYSWAYCMAVEAICDMSPPPRARWLRALCLERERIANHLGDLGALGNDAGFRVSLAQFSRLKEDVLRMNERAFGRRYLMDAIIPGGVSVSLKEEHRLALLQEIPRLVTEIGTLREIFDDHAGLQDRFTGAGRVSPELARQLGAIGLVARASGQQSDLRVDHPHAPYDELAVRVCSQSAGDVAARVAIRFDEILESLRLSQVILENLPLGGIAIPLAQAAPERLALGWVEGWRGPVFIGLETDGEGGIRRCHPHDPSWQNWPILEHAIIGNIIPDFPLINKSFNLSYSGHDL
jgi:Ni,Fe-hydrogenase III large subunit/Ni,Fe-hydrogenase III component G